MNISFPSNVNCTNRIQSFHKMSVYFAWIPKTRASTSTRSSDLVTLVFEADPNWLVVTVLFSKTNIKKHICRSTVDYIDGRRERNVDGDILPYLDGRKMRVHGLPKQRCMHCEMAVLLGLRAWKIQLDEVGIRCIRLRGNGSSPYGLYGGRERTYLAS